MPPKAKPSKGHSPASSERDELAAAAVLVLPFWLARIVAGGADIANRLTFGLTPMPITPDQVRSLGRDNVVAPGARGFADLGIAPVAMEAVLPEYLWRFRSSVQYAAIKRSAKNLRAE
jgi:NADH dehydrogenase